MKIKFNITHKVRELNKERLFVFIVNNIKYFIISGIYSTYAQEPIYRRPNNVGLRTFSSESAVQHAQHVQHVQQSIRPTEFKEPFPMNSTCSSSPSTPLSPAPRGSRSSMSSVDSGWASAPLALSSFGTRASNSSLNSDKTSNSSEEVVTRAQIKQRRLSSISSSGIERYIVLPVLRIRIRWIRKILASWIRIRNSNE